ncbi:hypothetical protein AN948_03805 [Rhodococcus sp. ADH]|nr:hypothetical protein AN948_03805 [Rhodococcus sp. ADH]
MCRIDGLFLVALGDANILCPSIYRQTVHHPTDCAENPRLGFAPPGQTVVCPPVQLGPDQKSIALLDPLTAELTEITVVPQKAFGLGLNVRYEPV